MVIVCLPIILDIILKLLDIVLLDLFVFYPIYNELYCLFDFFSQC